MLALIKDILNLIEALHIYRFYDNLKLFHCTMHCTSLIFLLQIIILFHRFKKKQYSRFFTQRCLWRKLMVTKFVFNLRYFVLHFEKTPGFYSFVSCNNFLLQLMETPGLFLEICLKYNLCFYYVDAWFLLKNVSQI